MNTETASCSSSPCFVWLFEIRWIPRNDPLRSLELLPHTQAHTGSNTPPISPSSNFRSTRKAFSLTPSLRLENWLLSHTLPCWEAVLVQKFGISSFSFQVCTTHSMAVSGEHVHKKMRCGLTESSQTKRPPSFRVP